MEPKKITKIPENTTGYLRLDFDKGQFDALIENKGYPVVWERAIPCPCTKGDKNPPQSSCKNCEGTGWVFINPYEIKGIITSINKDTKYREWSVERIGTFAITVNSKHKLNFMDRITVLGSKSVHSERALVKKIQDKYFIRTIYPIVDILDIFKLESVYKKLKLLEFGVDYIFSGNQVIFNTLESGDSISISYLHELQYHILDLNHDVRNTVVIDNYSREQNVELPISAIARRTHTVINSYEFIGDEIFNNSYK
ncbi:MAG: hypothetical protein WC982_14245 [Advenella sp.]